MAKLRFKFAAVSSQQASSMALEQPQSRFDTVCRVSYVDVWVNRRCCEPASGREAEVIAKLLPLGALPCQKDWKAAPPSETSAMIRRMSWHDEKSESFSIRAFRRRAMDRKRSYTSRSTSRRRR